MPRARSGSFYCPLEPALPALSIAQKAAISTAPSLSSLSSSTAAKRRHVRSSSFDGADVPASVTLPASTLQTLHAQTPPLSLRSSHLSLGAKTRKYPWSPSRPSPLRRQVDVEPRCPSALWTTYPELLPLYASTSAPSSSSCSSVSVRMRKEQSLRRSVLRHCFAAGQMGEKANLYGLRVAWCVFGDVKDSLAKDIFTPRTESQQSHALSSSSPSSTALSPPPIRSSGLRRERSFVWDVQGPLVSLDEVHAHVDHLLASSSDESETDSEPDEDETDSETESESDLDLDLDLDLDEDVHRDIIALLSAPLETGAKLMETERWDALALI